MANDSLDGRADDLSQKIRDGFGTGGRTMEQSAAKAGRSLPKHVRRNIDTIAGARAFQNNPKLARQVDQKQVDRAYKDASKWLTAVDRSARRKAIALNVVTEIAFRIFVVAGLVLAVLIWRDLI